MLKKTLLLQLEKRKKLFRERWFFPLLLKRNVIINLFNKVLISVQRKGYTKEYTRCDELDSDSIEIPKSIISKEKMNTKFYFPESLIEEATFEIIYNIRKYVIEKNTIITKDDQVKITMKLENLNDIDYFVVSNNKCILEDSTDSDINQKLKYSQSNNGLNLIYNYLSVFFDRKENLLHTKIINSNNHKFFEIWIPIV
jgi:hypothetical protein